eukprot:SAG31_NODE_142_length_22669_cov_18.630040_12_plen_312_part_00
MKASFAALSKNDLGNFAVNRLPQSSKTSTALPTAAAQEEMEAHGEGSAVASAPSSPRFTDSVTAESPAANLFVSKSGCKRSRMARNGTERVVQTRLELTAFAAETGAPFTLQLELSRGECSGSMIKDDEGNQEKEKHEKQTSLSAEVASVQPFAATLVSHKGPISGVLRVGGWEGGAVDFHAGESKSKINAMALGSNVKAVGSSGEQILAQRNFLVNPHEYSGCTTRHCIERQKVSLTNLSTSTTCEISLGGGWEATLVVRSRKATELEMTRQDGTEALLKAEKVNEGTTHRTHHNWPYKCRDPSFSLLPP